MKKTPEPGSSQRDRLTSPRTSKEKTIHESLGRLLLLLGPGVMMTDQPIEGKETTAGRHYLRAHGHDLLVTVCPDPHAPIAQHQEHPGHRVVLGGA